MTVFLTSAKQGVYSMIREAKEKDIDKILDLLDQVHEVHSDGRPDIFVVGERKYNSDDVKRLMQQNDFYIFCHANEQDEVDGYAFCQLQETRRSGMVYHKNFFIDDICVDKNVRRQHVGTQLYEYVKSYAKSIGCYHVLLNVWELNNGARAFYESLGMKPLETRMEEIIL